MTDPLARAREIHEAATSGEWGISGRGYTLFGSDGVALAEGYDGYEGDNDPEVEQANAEAAEARAINNARAIAFEHNVFAALLDVAEAAGDTLGIDPRTLAGLDAVFGKSRQQQALDRLHALIEKEAK